MTFNSDKCLPDSASAECSSLLTFEIQVEQSLVANSETPNLLSPPFIELKKFQISDIYTRDVEVGKYSQIPKSLRSETLLVSRCQISDLAGVKLPCPHKTN